MNLPLDHEEVSEMLPAAALDLLEPAELQPVLAHVRDCQECAGMLREYREAAGLLALSLPRRAPAPERAALLRRRLLARARKQPLPLPRSVRAIFAVERWTGWMVAAGLAALLVTHHGFHRPLDYGWIVAGLLAISLVILGWYARLQRRRAAALLQRLGESDSGPS